MGMSLYIMDVSPVLGSSAGDESLGLDIGWHWHRLKKVWKDRC